MPSFRTLLPTLALAAAAALASACSHPAPAPVVPAADSAGPRPEATRSELEAELATQKSKDPNSPVVGIIQRRLENGDIQPGDLIALQVEDEQELSDTFTVRNGQVLVLPHIPDEIPLKGILRSELDDYLTKQIGQYIRDPRVDAVALIRVAVLGAVSKPGFYSLPAETLASDVIMAAGGPSGDANLKKTTVERGQSRIADADAVQKAFQRGVSLDQMNLHSGDQFVVPQSTGGLLGALKYIGAITGLVWLVVRISGGR
ncbi:MAG TPA: polysaccharide biosynthesis/export family protein [Gemmatimonadales bacterium]|nr:polysaccharide biosynthesis/export family protein [Gemmatimonadales bacterium]